ncbi:ABC transporter substrate binding protein [Desulfovibrio inopinatus]|uniref:ABC transporter substrate binding protein n=1 Tax=Desulfovibrio inopinatus TaxID=102109 RepID=UPI0004084B84|nr:ABC transporter substrate binding protein [Desulfovibrio inopinatus]
MSTKHIVKFVVRCLVLCSLVWLAACGSDEPPAQDAVFIGIVAPQVGLDETLRSLQFRLKDDGLTNQDTVRIHVIEPTAENIQSLIEERPQLIISFFTRPTHLVLEKLSQAGVNIPVLFGAVSDPVSSKFVDNPDKPTLATGVSVGDWQGRSLSRVTALFPRVHRVVIPIKAHDKETQSEFAIMEEASDVAGVSLDTIRYTQRHGLLSILKRIPRKTQFIWILRASQNDSGREKLIAQAISQEIGLFGPQTDWCTAGALVCVAPDPSLLGQQMAEMAVQVLGGKPISEIPVEPVRLFAVVNADTARRIGISVTPEVRNQADLIIE